MFKAYQRSQCDWSRVTEGAWYRTYGEGGYGRVRLCRGWKTITGTVAWGTPKVYEKKRNMICHTF